MAHPHLKNEVYYSHLLEIKLPSGQWVYYQNFKPLEQYTFEGQIYSYFPFQVSSNSEQLELNSESLEIQVANTETIRNIILAEGDIRKSLVIVKTIFPDDLSARVETERTRISNLSFNKGVINIACTSPISAINGLIPSKVFEPRTFPALPYYNSPNISRNV